MSVPSDPTIASIVTEALKRAGRTTPSATQISDATTHQFREVKAEINTVTGLLPELLTVKVVRMTAGGSVYDWPVDAQDIQSLQVVDYIGSDGYTGTIAGTAGAYQVTLSPSLNITLEEIKGRYLYIVAGTGVGSYGQVINWDNSTKAAVIETTLGWQGAAAPVTNDTYVLENNRQYVWQQDKNTDFNRLVTPQTPSIPRYVSMRARQAHFYECPLQQYPLIWTYWANLDYLDDTGTVFTRHLRTYRHLWVQGIAVKCMQRYDEDRYMSELKLYQDMLLSYGSHSSQVRQMNFFNV